jgi:hypothetical protein
MLTNSSQILDDSQRRALRVYRDKKTKAVRFQSSVLGGETDKYVTINLIPCEALF